MVTERQWHKCRQTCYKTKVAAATHSCRFHFPKESCEVTKIVRPEETPEQKPKARADKTTIQLKRTEEEGTINNYSPELLEVWAANMDLSFVVNPYAAVAYIASYACKSEGEETAMMKNAAKSLPDNCKAKDAMKEMSYSMLHGRQVGCVESAWRCIPRLPLSHKSIAVDFVATQMPDRRVRMMKPKEALLKLPPDSEDIFVGGKLESYKNRPTVPQSVHKMCFADFMSWYRQVATKQNEEEEEEQVEESDEDEEIIDDEESVNVLPNEFKVGTGSKSVTMKKRRRKSILNYFHYNEELNPQEFWYSKFLLFQPWRTESMQFGWLLGEPFDSTTVETPGFFDQPNMKNMKANWERYESNDFKRLEAIFEAIKEDPSIIRDHFTEIAPEATAAYFDQANIPSDEEDEIGIEVSGKRNTIPELGEASASFQIELAGTLVTAQELETLKQQLRRQQRIVYDKLETWCKAVVHARETKTDHPKPPRIFVSGAGGEQNYMNIPTYVHCIILYRL